MYEPSLQCHVQVLAAVPITHHVAAFYTHHPGFCSMLINTAFSLAAALFVFIILPAGDFIIGEEPPEAVSGPHIPSHARFLSRPLTCMEGKQWHCYTHELCCGA